MHGGLLRPLALSSKKEILLKMGGVSLESQVLLALPLCQMFVHQQLNYRSPAKSSAIHIVTVGPSRELSTFLALEMHHVDGLAFNEQYFQSDLSQSRIDGQSGSSACTLIAVLTSHRLLTRVLPLSTAKGAYPLAASFEVSFALGKETTCMSVQSCGLLSVDQALTCLSHVPIGVQREFFLTAEKGWITLLFL